MYRSLKMRIEPDSEQRKVIEASFRYHCYVYNALITACKLYFKTNGRLPSQFDLNKLCTRIWQNCPFLHRYLYQNAMNETAKRVLQAFAKCEENRRKRDRGKSKGKEDAEATTPPETGLACPRFRKPSRFYSYTNPLHMEVFTERNGRRMLKVSKVKGPVRCYNQKTPIPGVPRTCTIEKVDKGTHTEYYACLSCWDDIERRRGDEYLSGHSPDAVGIDMGVSKTATLSNGTVYGNDHMYSKLLDLFRKKHEAFSTMLPGTPGYRKARSRLSHLYGRLRGILRNNVETITRQIVDAFDIICMEDLKVGKIRRKSRGKRMTNAYDDASLGMLRRRLIDKAIEAGRRIIPVDPKWTSQVCSGCGACVRKGLEVRTHVCPECGLTMERDLNSAVNILIWGLTGNPFPERWDE